MAGTCSVVTKNIPDHTVVAGVPARVIGTFDGYVKKMINAQKYPADLKPKRQIVSDELAKIMWDQFNVKHSGKG